MKIRLTALAALASAWQPASALPPAQPRSQHVQVADLDLATFEGWRVLDARLVGAARRVCHGGYGGGPLEWVARGRCVRATLAAARRDARLAIRSAPQPQFARSGR